MKKIFSFAAVLLAMTGLVFAEGEQEGKSGGQVELRVLNYRDLTSANASTEIGAVWDAFTKKHPEIKITREDLFNEPFHNKTEAYAAANRLPDVVYAWPSGRSTTLHQQKLLKDLTPLIQKDGLKSQYTAAALDPTGQASGYLAILPFAITSSHAFFVNTAVLEACGLQPAKTYDELKAQVPVLKAKGYETVLMANQEMWVMQSCLFSLVAGRFGGVGWEKKIFSGQAKFTDKDFVDALTFIQTLYKDNVLSQNTLATGYGDVVGQFATKKGAYLIDGDWRIGTFITDPSTGKALIPIAEQPKIKITVFPDIPGAKLNKSSSTTLGTGWGISASIPSGSPKEAAAWELVKWLSGKDVQTYRLQSGGISTPTAVGIDASKLQLEPLQIAGAQLASEYTSGTAVIDAVFHSDIANAINDGLAELGRAGGKTPQQVAQAAQAAFDTWKKNQR
ncbi:MAG: extracellular solute-binding protein [Spirochaetaceae bacterium]|jgi:raffinose/stachyose/melibiose transport system substrate-binding protein|nr:extracellular solute-binding protein [Spirochaetaceae bacterium]